MSFLNNFVGECLQKSYHLSILTYNEKDNIIGCITIYPKVKNFLFNIDINDPFTFDEGNTDLFEPLKFNKEAIISSKILKFLDCRNSHIIINPITNLNLYEKSLVTKEAKEKFYHTVFYSNSYYYRIYYDEFKSIYDEANLSLKYSN